MWLNRFRDICLATAWLCAIACDSRDEKKLNLFHPEGRLIKLMIEMELRVFSSKIKAFSTKVKRRVRHLMGRACRYQYNIKGKTLARPGSFSKYFDWGKKNLRHCRSKPSLSQFKISQPFWWNTNSDEERTYKILGKKLKGKRPHWRYWLHIRE